MGLSIFISQEYLLAFALSFLGYIYKMIQLSDIGLSMFILRGYFLAYALMISS